ncbi:MAG TPA: histidine phosphatase family protein [Candidatus Methylomirabilis sp.]|nr:histidine phosphatase family protein [Candidatus Methylomirabilis sp.]
MPNIVLARHCQTDWNVEQRIQGQSDRPLNTDGLHQAGQLAKCLRDDTNIRIKAIVTSDLRRAHETALIIGETIQVPRAAIHSDCRYRECHYGALEGLTRNEVLERLSGRDPYEDTFEKTYDYSPFGGEDRSRVLARNLEALQEHCASLVEQADAHLLVIGHGRSLGTLLSHFGLPFRLDQGTYQVLNVTI